MNKNHNSELELVKDILAGREEAFRDLVESNQGKVYNLCLGFLKNTEDAEDVSQEVFIHVYQKIGDFQGKSALSTWIYRITVNKCLEKLRSLKRQKRWAQLVSIFDSTGNYEARLSDFSHPGIALENKERGEILWSRIEKLAENQKTAFVLHKFENQSYAEIADIMETSLSSVESLMFRAKKNLRNMLEHYYKNDRK